MGSGLLNIAGGNGSSFTDYLILLHWCCSVGVCAQKTMASSKSETCCGNLAEILQKFEGDIYFVKKLVTSNVGRSVLSATNVVSGPCQLSIPRSFVEAHGDKFQKSVALRTGNKTWIVRVSVCPSRSPPEVTFCGGWRQFVADNGLAKGDELIFYWTAMSNFEVYMFNSRGESKGPQILRMQPFTDEIQVSQQKVKKPLRGNKREELTTEEFENLLYESNCGRSSVRPDASEEQLPSLPAAFQKRLRFRYRHRTLEIPVLFARRYSNWLKRRLHFQGIHEDSPVRIVCCTYHMDRGRFRFYLTEGWGAFWKENRLREGQELVFTLVSDSFLKVREVPGLVDPSLDNSRKSPEGS